MHMRLQRREPMVVRQVQAHVPVTRTERRGKDFVHDALTSGRPVCVITFVDQSRRQSQWARTGLTVEPNNVCVEQSDVSGAQRRKRAWIFEVARDLSTPS
jgi:hypothetical protein